VVSRGPEGGDGTGELNFLELGQTPLGFMDVSEFMDPTDLDFLNVPIHMHGHI